MRMPLAQVVESPVVRSGPPEKVAKCRRVVLGAADEVGGRAGHRVDGEFDDAEMVWRDLLAHEDPADLAPPGPPEASAQLGALLTG